MEPAFGTDISVHNGKINWNTMIADNVKFVFIRAKYGTFTDRRFAVNWPNAKAAGLLRGAYLFYRPANDVEHDVRSDGSQITPPPFEVLEPNLRACLERITQLTGRRPIIYTAAGYWNKFLGALAWAQGYDLWAANWVTTWTPSSRPRLPTAWTNYRFWQYAADGNAQGPTLGVESADIDLNLFNGDLDALLAYANTPSLVAASRGVQTEAVPELRVTKAGATLRSQPVNGPILTKLKLREVLTLSNPNETTIAQIGKRGHWLEVLDKTGQTAG